VHKVGFSDKDTKSFITFLSNECQTRASIGQILCIMLQKCKSDSDDNIISFIYKIMTSNNFETCSGTLQSFYKQLKSYECELTNMLHAAGLYDVDGGKTSLKRYKMIIQVLRCCVYYHLVV